jgi:hypothetical protein
MRGANELVKRSFVLLGLPVACGLVVGLPDDPRFGPGPVLSRGGGGGSAGSPTDGGDGGASGEQDPGTGGVSGTTTGGGTAGNGATAGGGGDSAATGTGGGGDEGGAGAGGAGSGGTGPSGKATVSGPVFIPPGGPTSSVPVTLLSRKRGNDSLAAPELDLFWADAEGAVHHVARQENEFSVPTKLGGTTAVGPVAVSHGSDRIDVFIVGASNTVLTKRLVNGSWSPAGEEWTDLGGTADQGIAATPDAGELVHLFTVSADGSVRYLDWRPGTVGAPAWQLFDGVRADGGISATTTSAGSVNVFIRADGVIRQKFLFDGRWQPDNAWQPVMPQGALCDHLCPCNVLDMDPTVVSSGPDRVDVVFSSNSLYNLRWRRTDDWRCEHLDSVAMAPPVATVRDTHRFDLFALASDGDAMGKSWQGHEWSPWYQLGATFTDIATASTGPDSVFVFGRLANRTIGFLEWTSIDGWTPK